MRLIETDTLSNQNISSALEVGTYTADAARHIVVRVFADQVAGSDDYVVYATIQLAGAGSAYQVVPTTTATVGAVTAIAMTTIGIPVSNTDVLKVYLTGAAGDTTTPDTRVEFWEYNYLQPTTTGRTLDVAATGEAGLDFDNIKAATGATTLTNITVPIVTTLTGHTAQTGDNYARIGAPVGASISADVAAVKAETASILTDTGTTLDAALAVVDANVDAILTDTGTTLDGKIDAILVDTGTTLDGKLDTIDTNVDAILVDTGTTLDAALAVVDANVDAILVDTGTTLDAALAVVDANVDAILTDTGTTLDGKIDAILVDTSTTIDAALAVVDANVDAILADTNELETDWADGGRLDLILDAASAPTAAQVADAVWDEDIVAAHNTADTAGALLDDLATPANFKADVTNVSVDEIQASAIADLFNTDSGTTYASAVAGSVVKETADNAGGSSLTEAGIATAVWAHSAAAVAMSEYLTGEDITLQRGITNSLTITGMGSVADRTELYFTVKDDYDDLDSSAILQISENIGMLYINGVVATAVNGSITVDDAVAGDITVEFAAVEAAKLPITAGLIYDVKKITASDVDKMTSGDCSISGDVTRAVT